ncbi:DUF4166 domain-containing protein [Bacillus aerolatus]|uniref:DUF4166 domain-containing protein n=1 Tax=Bacillus aerolatus TaxID=2653354 RepID=A0A6I1FJ16_9BACI|nr:DUF4166 domain-containing protein [Bacillus aerolatus]
MNTGSLFIVFGRKIPLPAFLYGNSRVIESYQEESGLFHINVHVSNPLLGTLFAYKGSFREMGSGEE